MDALLDGPPPANPALTLEVPSASTNEIIPVDLTEVFQPNNDQEFDQQLQDITNLLRDEKADAKFWVTLVQQCWAHGKSRVALETAELGLQALSSSYSSSPSHYPTPLHLLRATYHIALSRRAPKTRLDKPRTGPIGLTKDKEHPEFPRYGVLDGVGPQGKEHYLKEADRDIDLVERNDGDSKVARDVRASWLMARGRLDEASKLFERILSEEPTQLMALMGRARIQFSTRSFRPALKTYQQVLKLCPSFLPDPRIGIGLCFWMLGDREKARKAWERSMAVNPSSPSPSAPLLLGLLHLNASKDILHPDGDSARQTAYETGLKLVQSAFKKDNTSAGAAAMGPIASHLAAMGGAGQQNALKLAERMLAFADSRLLVAEAHLARARAIDSDTSDQAEYNIQDVLAAYLKAVEAHPEEVMAQLGVGSCFVRTEQFPAAINAYETLLRRHPKCVEALAALASIHTHLAFTFHSVSDSATARKAAKESYAALLRIISAGTTGAAGGADQRIVKSERVRVLAGDRDLYVEVARLWSDEGTVERSLQAWEKAAAIEEESAEDLEDDEIKIDSQDEDVKPEKKDPVDPRIRNNLGVQHYNRRPLGTSGAHLSSAVEQFELALLALSKRPEGLDTPDNDAVLTALTFNAGAAYEALGEREKAKGAWEQVLRGHSEFVEAKARLALLLMKSRHRTDLDSAHVLLKEALTSSPHSSELRALYTYFLVETGQPKVARDFARSTIKEISRHDLYALCASGMLYYHEARENKSTHKDALKDRTQKFTRAAEFFDKALQLSPQCAFAAQGLAIALAEGALGNGPVDTAILPGGQAPQALTEQQARLRNARDALGILMKVKESVNEASVYVNIGHCHFARDEYEKAIENYEMASKRYLNDKSSTVLWYLARGWYHKALRQSTYADLQRAIDVGEKATAINPKDLANVFNMAVLKQKCFEIVQGLPASKRTAVELDASFDHLKASEILFRQLVEDDNPHPPYPRDVVKQRLSYTTSLNRRYETQINIQREYEESEQGKLQLAKDLREAEQKKRDEAEREKLEALQKKAEQLAEQRKKMREEAEQWSALSNAWADEDDDGEGGGKKKKSGGGDGKKKRSKKEQEEGETESDGEEKPAKKKKAAKKDKPVKSKKKSKAVVDSEDEGDEKRKMDVDEKYDEDDEDAPVRSKRKTRVGKNVKSTEFVESSDEDE